MKAKVKMSPPKCTILKNAAPSKSSTIAELLVLGTQKNKIELASDRLKNQKPLK